MRVVRSWAIGGAVVVGMGLVGIGAWWKADTPTTPVELAQQEPPAVVADPVQGAQDTAPIGAALAPALALENLDDAAVQAPPVLADPPMAAVVTDPPAVAASAPEEAVESVDKSTVAFIDPAPEEVLEEPEFVAVPPAGAFAPVASAPETEAGMDAPAAVTRAPVDPEAELLDAFVETSIAVFARNASYGAAIERAQAVGDGDKVTALHQEMAGEVVAVVGSSFPGGVPAYKAMAERVRADPGLESEVAALMEEAAWD